jgi:PAS domain-containing protein
VKGADRVQIALLSAESQLKQAIVQGQPVQHLKVGDSDDGFNTGNHGVESFLCPAAAADRGSSEDGGEEAQETVMDAGRVGFESSSPEVVVFLMCGRAANRRSASSSRARKKKYIEKLTTENRRLKRISRILAILPDLVMVVNREGHISFASWRSEKMLQVGRLPAPTSLEAPV